jgi:hypothetical protein
VIRDAPKSLRRWTARGGRKTEPKRESGVRRRLLGAAAAVGAAGLLAAVSGFVRSRRRRSRMRALRSRLHLKT